MIINLKQNTEEWLEWRKEKIGASEIPIIIGVSKWSTPYLLWQRKLGFAPPQKDNPAMQQGRELEPIVRNLANVELERRFEPAVVANDELPWAIASLDGICGKAILEIKCPSQKDHTLALLDQVPEHYFPQIQWQLFCSGLKTCYYVSFYDDAIATVKVSRDDAYIKDVLLEPATIFYQHLQDMTEPEKLEDDILQITDEQFGVYAQEWIEVNRLFSECKKKDSELRKKLIDLTDDGSCKGFGISLTRSRAAGHIDWQRMYADLVTRYPSEMQEFDCEKYRKEEIGKWRFSIDQQI